MVDHAERPAGAGAGEDAGTAVPDFSADPFERLSLALTAHSAIGTFRWKEVLILATVLAVMSYVAFVWLLKLQFQVWPSSVETSTRWMPRRPENAARAATTATSTSA